MRRSLFFSGNLIALQQTLKKAIGKENSALIKKFGVNRWSLSFLNFSCFCSSTLRVMAVKWGLKVSEIKACPQVERRCVETRMSFPLFPPTHYYAGALINNKEISRQKNEVSALAMTNRDALSVLGKIEQWMRWKEVRGGQVDQSCQYKLQLRYFGQLW